MAWHWTMDTGHEGMFSKIQTIRSSVSNQPRSVNPEHLIHRRSYPMHPHFDRNLNMWHEFINSFVFVTKYHDDRNLKNAQ